MQILLATQAVSLYHWASNRCHPFHGPNRTNLSEKPLVQELSETFAYVQKRFLMTLALASNGGITRHSNCMPTRHPPTVHNAQAPSPPTLRLLLITMLQSPMIRIFTECESEDVKSLMLGNGEDGFGEGSLLQRWMKMLNVETSDAVSRGFCPSHITYYVK